MVNFYCRACGLYITVPSEFSGGRGMCPRCKMPLRIPRPVPEDSTDYEEGLRYIAYPVAQASAMGEDPQIVTADFGPSARYRCAECGERYESLRVSGRDPGVCPRCTAINQPTLASVPFPRQQEPEVPAEASMEKTQARRTEGVFFPASRSENQSPSDSIIQGLPFAEETGGAPGLALNGATKHEAAGDEELAAAISGAAEEPSPTDARREARRAHADRTSREPMWYYLLKGHHHGPVSTSQLRQLLRSGRVSGSVLAWREKMHGWKPIEQIEELADACRTEQIPESKPLVGVSQAQRARRFNQNFAGLVWMFVAGFCLLVLMYVTKETLADLGQAFFVKATLALSLVFLAGCGYSAWMIWRNREFYTRVPRSVRLRGWAGLGGLLACVAVTWILAATWREKDDALQSQEAILQAKRIFSVLVSANVEESYLVVHWEALHVNGEDFGTRFQKAQRLDEKRELIEEVFDQFVELFQPQFLESDMKASHLTDWRVERRHLGHTVVSVRIPSTGRRAVFTLEAGRLIALELG